MKGMVLAAGFGTRFRPATYEIPKPLVPICNRPLIDYAVDSLLEAGVAEVIVNLHHLPELLLAHLDSTYAGRCVIRYSHEEEQILGTGGGIRRARPLLEYEDSFFVVNGDTIQFPPLRALEERREAEDALAALLLRQPPANDRFTAVFLDENRVTGFGSGRGEPMMFSGAHSISSRIFSLLPDREVSGITEDVYIPLTRSAGEVLAGLPYDGPWFDIGTPRRYLEASHSVRELMLAGAIPLPADSVADSGGTIRHASAQASAAGGVVLGSESAIEAGSKVRGSVLWERCSIGRGAEVIDSILCNGVELGGSIRVVNALLCRAREMQYAEGIRRIGEFAAVPVDPQRQMIVEHHRGS